MKAKTRIVAGFLICILSAAASNVSAQEYMIEWFNNMNYDDAIYHNSAGYCTNLTVELVSNPWGLEKINTKKVYDGKLPVQNAYTMNVSTSPLSGKCVSMTLTGTCVYNKFGTTVTETDKTEVDCSSGRAVFLINAFDLSFRKQ